MATGSVETATGGSEARPDEPPSTPRAEPGLVARLRFYLVLALSGGVIMALEILSSRVLAPHFGNSVYVWGSIISVFLAALSVGYALGGRLADRRPDLASLGRLVLLAAGSQALLLVYGRPMARWLGELTGGSPGGTLLATAVLYGPVSILLATVSPYAVRLAARNLAHLGDTTGRLFALSTTGSLVGTLGCTFVLVPAFELRGIMAFLVVVTTAAATAALVEEWRRERWSLVLAAGLVVFAAWQGASPPPLAEGSLFHRVTPYQTLEVREVEGTRYLISNRAVQGAMDVDTREAALPVLRHVSAPLLFQPDLRRMLVLGMGAGLAGPYLQRQIPDLEVDYVEIDAGVVEVAESYFGFRRGATQRVHVEDARRFLSRRDERWDLIFCDAYVGLSVPFHLTTQEFMRLVSERLTPQGIFVVNLAAGLGEPFSRALYHTVSETLGPPQVFSVFGAANVLLVAGPGVEYQGRDRLQERAAELDRRWAFSPSLRRVANLIRTEGVALEGSLVLTDAFAPVDHLIPMGRALTLEDLLALDPASSAGEP